MRVLVVEDDELHWQAIEPVLRSQGHEPYWASKASQAIEFLAVESIEIVLLDVDLGSHQLSGIDVLRAMVEHDEWRGIPCIIVSGMPDFMIRERAKPPVEDLLKHVKVMLAKPLSIERLAAAMARAVQK
jgi:DNA-binding NtrC family response regulator